MCAWNNSGRRYLAGVTTSLLALCLIAAAWSAYLGHEAADDDRLRPGWLVWLASPLVVLWWLFGQAACIDRPFVDETCPVLYTQAADLLVLPTALVAFGGALLVGRRRVRPTAQ